MKRRKTRTRPARLGKKKKEPLPSLEKREKIFNLTILCLSFVIAVAINTGPISNNDYGLHLRLGREIAEARAPLRIDDHSHTKPGAKYPDHEWLLRLVFYLFHKAFGNGGMVLLKGLVIGLALVGVLIITLGIRVQKGHALSFKLDHQQLPVSAVKFIESHDLRGPIFNDYNFGGYLLWKAWPDFPVFVDGRIELYKGKVLEEYLAVSKAAPGWEEIVEKYGITFFLVRPERKIAQALVQKSDWELVYFDYNSCVYVRHDLFPDLKRLEVITPYGHRDRTKRLKALEEISYLLNENPLFFGGYKIRAFLWRRLGNFEAAREDMIRYLELHPEGIKLEETRSLINGLKDKGQWEKH